MVSHAGAMGLFDGLSAAWFRGMSYSLVRFEAYEVAKRHLQDSKTVTSTLAQTALAGVSAGLIGGLVSNPGG